jgi:anti-sigma B factor antagonist
MPFETEQITLDSGIVVLALSGTMTMGNLLQRLEFVVRDLTKENQNRIVIDMSKISYLDSASIGVLLNCSALVRNAGGQLRLAALADRVLATLKLVGLDGLLPISPSREEAVSEITPPHR